MAEKKVLIDNFGSIRLSLSESSDGRKKLIARGEYGRADVPTENKRIYPRSIWEREIGKIIESMHGNQVYGELDHPGDGKTKLTRVSHLMKNLELQPDGTIVGEAEVIDTPNGSILKKIIESGGVVGISSRGYGSTSRNEDGYEVVQEDYTYLTHDFVADPAVISAVPKFTEEGKTAKGESKIMETKDQKQPEQTVNAPAAVATKTYSEEDVQRKLKEHEDKLSEKFAQELLAKLDEAKAAVTEEVKNQLMSDPQVAGAKLALDKIKEAIRPFVVPEDVENVLKQKDEEITSLKAKLADKDKEIQTTEAKAVKIGESAKNLTLKFALNDLLKNFEHRKDVEEAVGAVTAYKSMEDLSEAVSRAKAAVSKRKEEEKAKADEASRVEEKHQKELKTLKDELEESKKTASEALRMAQKYQMGLYVEQRLKGNPNAPKLKKLVEGVESKEKVDDILNNFSLDRSKEEEYNFIQNRLAKRKQLEEAAKQNKVVEQHLDETTRVRNPVTEGVDAELAALGQMDL